MRAEVDHIVLWVEDPVRSAAFYRDIVGFEPVRLEDVCFTMSKEDFTALRARLNAAGVDTSMSITNSFGARGYAPTTFYFADPDENVLEARYYEEG